MAEEALCGAADLVDLPFEFAHGPCFGGPAGIRIDDGDGAEFRASRVDGGCVVFRVGEVEQVGCPRCGQLHERDHGQGVMQGRRRVLYGNRHALARHHRVDLAAFPPLLLPLRVALAPPFAFNGQFGHVGFRRARALDGDWRRRRLVGVNPHETALRVRRARPDFHGRGVEFAYVVVDPGEDALVEFVPEAVNGVGS